MKTNETMDPLTRIQEEIKEVVRREEEYHRQLTITVSPEPHIDLDDQNANKTNISIDSTLEGNDNSLTINSVQTTTTQLNNNTNNKTEIATENLLSIHDDNHSNTPSLSSSVNGKESLDGHHSDDSGISASSSPVNGKSNDLKVIIPNGSNGKEHRYIGPNCYNMTPEPPKQKLMTRTVSTPHLAVTKPKFPLIPAHKGVMQRFIASRGKLQLNTNNPNSPNMIMLNGKSAATLLNVHSPASVAATQSPSSPTTLAINSVVDFNARNPTVNAMPTTTLSPAVIERDAEGRPIRPGYIPVELKIQRELKDLKSRESELKKIRKLRQSTSELDSIDNENIETDEDDDEEHCYGPGQLRSAKSINELCDTNHFNNSISPRATPSPLNFARHGNGGMRPAMSLAQLCDLDPEEAPSSHRLIAQFESLIQQNA